MTLYAHRPARLVRQVLGDFLVLLLVWLAVRVGRGTHARVAELATPGRDAEETALALSGRLKSAASTLDDAPLVGGTLAKPFRDLARTSSDLAVTAQTYQDTVAQVATFTGYLVAVALILLVLVAWLPRRIAWVVEATAVSRLVRMGPASADLLAVRALARQPLSRLARLGPEVVRGWQSGDPASTQRLAALELSSLGLLPPS